MASPDHADSFEPQQEIEAATEGVRQVFLFGFSMILIFGLIAIAILSIHEVSTRESLVLRTQQAIDGFYQYQFGNGVSDTPEPYTVPELSTELAGDDFRPHTLTPSERSDCLQQSLAAARTIRETGRGVGFIGRESIYDSLSSGCRVRMTESYPHDNQEVHVLLHFPILVYVFMTSISCSTIGSIVNGLRTKQSISIKDIAIGASAGFTLLLAIRGGQSFIFSLSMSDQIPVNIFGIAFSAMLVGSFTERAFRLLGRMVDEIEYKVESALESSPPQPSNQTSDDR